MSKRQRSNKEPRKPKQTQAPDRRPSAPTPTVVPKVVAPFKLPH